MQSSSNIGSTSVRRNLFHQNLSRRPASVGPANGTVPPGSNVVSNRPSNRLKPIASDSSTSSQNAKFGENRDIVIRDKNGGYKLDMPVLPRSTLVGDDGEELEELDAESGETAFGASENELEKEKFEAALVEMMIRHRNRQTTGEPDEILDIVHQSLRKKLASLDDDNWMFEPENDTRF
ncbi:uncharacterized protein N7459_009756 [Penicillium hispanicum]|uniref:uncharacterized protein n=1 Tax=Penicillium hispanicum TaxID=1080232 RepID=UPI0025422BF4|nr:uncharacterized protein N7459_009756 [Penicillium hispanicum]KAJ5570326.1 hypothetical protein N7459_009756 [Penicillium hispanicum]